MSSRDEHKHRGSSDPPQAGDAANSGREPMGATASRLRANGPSGPRPRARTQSPSPRGKGKGGRGRGDGQRSRDQSRERGRSASAHRGRSPAGDAASHPAPPATGPGGSGAQTAPAVAEEHPAHAATALPPAGAGPQAHAGPNQRPRPSIPKRKNLSGSAAGPPSQDAQGQRKHKAPPRAMATSSGRRDDALSRAMRAQEAAARDNARASSVTEPANPTAAAGETGGPTATDPTPTPMTAAPAPMEGVTPGRGDGAQHQAGDDPAPTGDGDGAVAASPAAAPPPAPKETSFVPCPSARVLAPPALPLPTGAERQEAASFPMRVNVYWEA